VVYRLWFAVDEPNFKSTRVRLAYGQAGATGDAKSFVAWFKKISHENRMTKLEIIVALI
jgi:hypothetical protein